ncbi:MAG TPA: SusC/RagA family TonB-linked outer membrane protein [Gemmatimonadaceae bacterium]|nr:SusC/RagA family TonB-linked outer membrane protein [Gemmatimonadaceae bacterium]
MHTRTLALARWAAAAAVFLGASVAYAQAGSIAVRVVDAGTSNPIDQAQVSIVGTNLGGLTNSDGRVLLRNIGPGTHQLRVLRVGYTEQKKPVTVTAGQQATAEFSLGAVAVSLAPVVTTATGETRRVEVGNTVAQIDVAKTVEVTQIKNVDDLLTARTTSLAVTQGNQTGSGSRMRIRGQSSLSLSNQPIFIIDGVRMTSNADNTNLPTGGATPSRVGDINPDEIENIEVIKGPSAAALYGTAAANGVVLITTKRGRAGQARWTAYAESGLLRDRNTYMTAYTLFGKQTSTGQPAPINFCNLQRVGVGQCTIDSVAALNIFEEDSLTPVDDGSRSQYGLQLSGGTEAIRYFLSGEREQETGVMKLPKFEEARMQAQEIPIREWTDRPNALGKNTVRMNLNSTVNPQLDLALSSGFINLTQRFSLESNATAGLGSQVFGGPGCSICAPERLTGSAAPLNTPLRGYRAWTPGYTWQEKNEQQVNRFILSGNANWRPRSWLQNRLTIGNDFAARSDSRFLFNGEGPPITNIYRNGFKSNWRQNLRNTTVDLGSTATYNPLAWLNLKTTVGAQYVNEETALGQAIGTELPPGAQTPNGAVTRTASEATTRVKTFGLFVEEAAAINDRLFLTAALRTDQNSAFGTDFQRVYYPKASLSWLISQENFFPTVGWLSELRIRTAYGASGVQPNSNDALRFFGTSIQSLQNADVGGLQIDALGNPDLRPERSTEIEGGFEAKLFNSRLSFDLTYYNKRTKDALISAIVAPSAGVAANVRRNLGAVRNEGWEILSSAQVLDRRYAALDVSLSYSTNENELISLGGTPPQIGTNTRVVEGYPLFGFWENKILGWEDKNGDGLLTYFADPARNEVFVDSVDSFIGYTQPRHLATLTTGFEFLNRRLRLQSLFDYRGGHRWYNNTERIRCTRPNCGGRMDPNASFEDQAMVIAALEHPARTNAGYFQKGDYVRFRELSLQYSFSNDLAAKLLRARSANIVMSGRNLKLWTAYRGTDPESDFQATVDNDVPSEFQTLGPPTYFILRLNVVF